MTTTRIGFLIRRAPERQEEAKARFVEACEWLARNLTESARKATDGLYVTETVMSSSLVQDIPRTATEYRLLGEMIDALQRVQEMEDR